MYDIEITFEEILEMSKTLPVSTDALADIAGVAGQLGIVGAKNIKDFTEVIAKATIALPEFAGGAEEIALVVAKAQNVFKLTTKESENLLSAWNELSNTTAANAAEISRFIENVGGAAQLMNITSADASALGATLVSMGEDGSDAGTRVGSAIIFMQKHLEEAASVAGTSTAEFKKKLDENAIMAIEDVIKGLEKIPSATDKNIAAMEIFGQIGGKVMTKLAGNLDQLNTNLATSQNAWNANISLQKEFDVASETTAKQWVQFNNNVNVVLIHLGTTILPVVNKGLQAMIELLNAANVNKIAESMSSIDEATKKLIKLRDEREKAGKDVENLNKQIKESMTLQQKMGEDLTKSSTAKNIDETIGTIIKSPYTIGKKLFGYAEGGVVPGPKGTPTFAMVHGGERIIPPGRGETVININFNNSTITDETIIDKVKKAISRETELTYQGAR